MKRLYLWLAGTAVAVLAFVANAGAASACGYLVYEPEVPSKLRQE